MGYLQPLKFLVLLFILFPNLLSVALAAGPRRAPGEPIIEPSGEIPPKIPDPDKPQPEIIPGPGSGSEPRPGSGSVGSGAVADDATDPPFSEPKLDNEYEEEIKEKVADLIKELAESIVDLLDSLASPTTTTTFTSIYPPSITLPASASIDQNMASQGCSIFSFYEAECADPRISTGTISPVTLLAACLCYTPIFAFPSSTTTSATPTATSFAYAPNIFDNAARACAAYTSDGAAPAPTITSFPSEPPATSYVGFCAGIGDVRAATTAAAASTVMSNPSPTSSGSTGGQGRLVVGVEGLVWTGAVALAVVMAVS